MSDVPFALDPDLVARLATHVDAEAKVARVLDELGPLGGRDVGLLGGGPVREAQLAARGARVVRAASGRATGLGATSTDALVAWWADAFRGPSGPDAAEAERVVRPGGRILVVHDYGRDDVSRLRPTDLPEYGAWSRRDGPFLSAGWKIRVVHAWWTFGSIDEARDLLAAAFGALGEQLAATLRRPRLSHNVAIYHRTREAAA